MAKVKYMGSADERIIEKGEDFGGRLATPLASELRWDRNNNWILDSDEAELSDEAVELLLEDPGFKDVSGLKRYPANEHQRLFLGMGASEKADDDDPDTQGSEGGPRTTTAGGSTRTSASGGSTAGGGSAKKS